MAPQILQVDNGAAVFPGKLTKQVIVCSIIAAFGGLMFGYDIGISGGVTSMDDFLLKFFPKVYINKNKAKENNYCKYDDANLQLFTSSLYLAAIFSSVVSSHCCKYLGRKRTMQLAALFFFLGALLNLLAQNIAMLIIGRILLGAGVGFANQVVPLFISEIAPANFRGGLNIAFQMLITIGILFANIVNYFTAKVHPHGWRISLGLAAVPAILLFFGSLIILETPTSLLERGKKDEALRSLRKIRGVEDVEREYEEILGATEASKNVKSPWKQLTKRSSRPQIICGTVLQVFQQFTGINVIMFYAPVLFQTMGLGSAASLLSSIVTGGFNVLATSVAIILVDRVGRRTLLIEAATQMFLAQCITGAILAAELHATNSLATGYAYGVLVLIVIFVSGFAWSWGPLGWLIPSETFPVETRDAGFTVAVGMNMLCTFIIAQTFLTMLCSMKALIFFFFAAWQFVMGLSAKFFLPETKGIPIDEMNEKVWKKHWYWKRFFDQDLELDEENQKAQVTTTKEDQQP